MLLLKHSFSILLCIAVFSELFSQQQSTYQLNFPMPAWKLASVPQNAPGPSGDILFPEAPLSNDVRYGYNRARLAWYNVNPIFLRNDPATPAHIANTLQQKNNYVRQVPQIEVYGDSIPFIINVNLLTFDLAFYPNERGPYNYASSPSEINVDGTLKQPETRWGGIMRSIDRPDFEDRRVRNIVIWLLDPFVYDTASRGGYLYIQLGNLSEDILRDGRKFHENGLNVPGTFQADTTVWGVIPANPPMNFSFHNQHQDVGFDGLNDNNERVFFNSYISNLQSFLSPASMQEAMNDPSNDNYMHYLGNDHDLNQVSILGRYKKFNGSESNGQMDCEDVDGDFVMNETEAYYQYRIELTPGMQTGSNFIADSRTNTVDLDIGPTDVTWHQFKIPIAEYTDKVGNIHDFKSIGFIRVFLTRFEHPVVLRLAELSLESIDTVSGIFEYHPKQLNVFPNPNEGRFAVAINNAQLTGIQIYNSFGQLIQPEEMALSENKIELDMGRQKGLFIIKIQTGDRFINSKVYVR